MLQKLDSLEEMSRDQQLKYLAKLTSISDNDYVVETLLKELAKVDYKKGQIITVFLQELATLEQVSDTLWKYIKSPESSDDVRDLAGIILKNLGDTTDPEEFLSYLENPKEVVDKETKKLLEITSVNPEAQIDFLDFLFSLPEAEQANLVNSLQEDYSSESLINVIIPAFESRQIPYMDEYFIKILGETRSPKAAAALQDFIEYSDDEALNKKAKISLNKLKLAGVPIPEPDAPEEAGEITQISSLYEFHTNIPDGLGNQAIIVSRKKPNGDIFMMNTVVNDIHGILDSFGFYGISKSDFRRIIQKFQEKSTGIPVSPEYCKYVLDRAEKINKSNKLPIPYEYLAWKTVLSDVKPVSFSEIESKNAEWVDKKLIEESQVIYNFPDFNHWFFEDDDNERVKYALDNIIEHIVKNKKSYIKNHSALEEYLEAELDKLLADVFTPEIRGVFKYRLQNIAFLFDIDELRHFRNLTATLAWYADPENGLDVAKHPFFREIIKKTILEGLIRYQHRIYTEEKQKTNPWYIKQIEKNGETINTQSQNEGIEEIIEILCVPE